MESKLMEGRVVGVIGAVRARLQRRTNGDAVAFIDVVIPPEVLMGIDGQVKITVDAAWARENVGEVLAPRPQLSTEAPTTLERLPAWIVKQFHPDLAETQLFTAHEVMSALNRLAEGLKR